MAVWPLSARCWLLDKGIKLTERERQDTVGGGPRPHRTVPEQNVNTGVKSETGPSYGTPAVLIAVASFREFFR